LDAFQHLNVGEIFLEVEAKVKELGPRGYVLFAVIYVLAEVGREGGRGGGREGGKGGLEIG
jgi:hypothetical protein